MMSVYFAMSRCKTRSKSDHKADPRTNGWWEEARRLLVASDPVSPRLLAAAIHRAAEAACTRPSHSRHSRTFFPKASAKGSSEKNVSPTTLHYHHHTTITTLPSPHSNHHYHHHTTITTLQSPLPSPHYHHHSTITSPPLLNSLLFLRLGWVSPRLARCTPLRGSCVSERSPAVRFCACGFVPAHPLRGSCVSERSRCAFLRMWICPRAPSAGIVRVGALPLCVFAHVGLCLRTLCGDRACRSAPAVRFCACYACYNLLRTSSAGIVRVGALPLCVFAHFTTCFAHPLRGSCVSEPSSQM